jgi:hypothetical protein
VNLIGEPEPAVMMELAQELPTECQPTSLSRGATNYTLKRAGLSVEVHLAKRRFWVKKGDARCINTGIRRLAETASPILYFDFFVARYMASK